MRIKRPLARLAANSISTMMRCGGKAFYRFVLNTLWERQPFLEPGDAQRELQLELYYPGYVDPDPGETALIERIFASYDKAKSDQKQSEPVFLPSSAWQNVVDSAFAPLNQGIATRDLVPFHHFLANFRSWTQTTGMEPSELISEYATDRRKREHYLRRVVDPTLRWWLRSESHGRDMSAVTTPRHGNQCGVMAEGHLIAPTSIFFEVYGRLLAGFVPGERPVVAELGAGFGKLLYFVPLNLGRACYVDFDLPESLACAAYFLMKTFPDHRFLLYGEADWDDTCLDRYDFILLPSFEIPILPDRSVDLFINENSLGVMRSETCRRYVKEICRAGDAFYHRNTESSRWDFSDGTASLLNREYPIPADEFQQVVRYRDISRMMYAGRLNFDMDMYWYYYRRISSPDR